MNQPEMSRVSLGADIGGSHITCRLYDLDKNQFFSDNKHRVDVSANASREVILSAWTEAITETVSEIGFQRIEGIGFAMPGPFDYESGVAWFKGVQKFDALFGVNVREELLRSLALPGDFRIRFQNDAACFAMGESFAGVAKDADRILAITLGTGFGTTFIHNHLPVAGRWGIPADGFLYHVPYGDSIADDYFSTRWFVNEYLSVSGKKITGVKELAEIYDSNSVAKMLFQTFGRNLGGFLSPYLREFDAGCLVIGGNISAAFRLFEEGLLEELRKNSFTPSVLVSELQEDAALAGSACLCDDRFYSRLTLRTS
jgi:glucokinase